MAAEALRLARENDPERLCAYAARVADALRLGWEIQVEPEPPTRRAHALAESEWRQGRRVVVLRFQPGFHDLPVEEQREQVTHELLHPLLHRLDDRADSAREWMPERTFRMWYEDLQLEVEYIIDRLVPVIAPHMPLPSADA